MHQGHQQICVHIYGVHLDIHYAFMQNFENHIYTAIKWKGEQQKKNAQPPCCSKTTERNDHRVVFHSQVEGTRTALVRRKSDIAS